MTCGDNEQCSNSKVQRIYTKQEQSEHLKRHFRFRFITTCILFIKVHLSTLCNILSFFPTYVDDYKHIQIPPYNVAFKNIMRIINYKP